MAIAYRSKTSGTGSGAWGGVVGLPSGATTDDVLLLFVSVDGNATGGTVTPPDSDWVSLGTAPHPTGDGEYIHGFIRRLNGSNSSWSAFSNNIGNEWTWTCLAYSGCDTTTPQDATAVLTTDSTMSASVRTVALSGITTVTANALVIWAATLDADTVNTGTLASPSGFTDRENTFSNFGPLIAAEKVFTSSGATGTLSGSATFASGNAGFGGFVVALRPASGPSPAITDVDTDEDVYDGQTGVAVTGTNMGAANADRTFALTQGAVSINQTETGSGNSTGATLTIAVNPGGAGAVGIKCGTAAVKCTLTAGGANGSLAINVSMPSGQLFVDIGTPNTSAQNRISATPVDLASGDQVQARGLGGGSVPSGLALYSDGTYGFTGASAAFEVRIWDGTDGTFSAWVRQDVSTPPQGKGRYFIRQDASDLDDFNQLLQGTDSGAGKVDRAAVFSWTDWIFPAGSTAGALAAAFASVASVTAPLTTAITLAAAPAATASMTAGLSTSITPAASVQAQCTVTAALTTQVLFAAAPAAQSTVTAGLTTGIALSAAPQSIATISAALQSNAAALAATPAAQATLSGALTTGISLQAIPAAIAALSAAITTQIQLAAAPAAVSTISATLAGTSAPLVAAPAAVTTLSAALTTGIPLASSSSSAAAVAASLTTGIRLAAAPGAVASMTAALTAGSGGMAASPAVASTLNASLTTGIRLAAAPAVAATVSANLTTGYVAWVVNTITVRGPDGVTVSGPRSIEVYP